MRVGMLQIQNNINDLQSKSIGRVTFSDKKSENKGVDISNISFKEVLDNKIFNDNSITFSDKANKNLMDINGPLNIDQITRLESGLGRFKERGAKTGVLLMDETAFVVNVNKQSIVSTMGKEKVKENVFSNIDSFAVV